MTLTKKRKMMKMKNLLSCCLVLGLSIPMLASASDFVENEFVEGTNKNLVTGVFYRIHNKGKAEDGTSYLELFKKGKDGWRDNYDTTIIMKPNNSVFQKWYFEPVSL